MSKASVVHIKNDSWGLFSQAAIQSWFGLLPDISISGQSDLWRKAPNVLFYFIHGLSRGLSQVIYPNQLHYPLPNVSLPIDQQKTDLYPKQVYVLYTSAFKSLVNWPQGFFTYLDTIRKAFTQQGHLQYELGVVYRYWLERGWRHPDFAFIQEAFDQYLQQRLVPSPSFWHLRRVQQNPTLKDKLTFIAEAEACRLLACSPMSIEKFVTDGYLIRYEQLYPDADTSRFKLLRRQEVLILAKRLQESLTLKQTAKYFGVSVEIVTALHEDGLLVAFSSPLTDDNFFWKFEPPTLTAFKGELRAVCQTSPLDNMCSLLKASQVLGVQGGRISTVIQLILEGEVGAYWEEDTKVGDILVAEDNIYLWLEKERNLRTLISRKQIAKMLGVKANTVNVWVENGRLRPQLIKGDMPLFTRSVVEQFREDYLFSEEAAEILEIGVLSIQKWARNGRLHPISGPNIDELHRYLFKRDEIRRYRPENRVTCPTLAKELGLSRSQLHEQIQRGQLQPVSGPGIDQMKHYLFLRDVMKNDQRA